MNTALKWIAALFLAGLGWLMVLFQSEYKWSSQRIPIRHLKR